MGKKSIKKNYIYNLIYQAMTFFVPLITTPYLARVLGADGVGEVSYAESFVSYFVLFATMGITTYGQREISYLQDDFEGRTRIFWQIKVLQFITSSVALAAYIVFALSWENSMIYIVFLFNILSVFVDVVWLFQGMEEFGRVVLRNLIIKGLNVVYIFTVVRSGEDIIKYVFGLSFFLFAGNLSLWAYVPKLVGKPSVKDIKPFIHVKEVLTLFLPTIAIQVYTVLDKTMIGLITRDSFENGYYEQAIKLSKMVLTIVTSLGAVMIPRIGYYLGRGDRDKVEDLMYKGYRFVGLLGVPLCFGLIGVSSNLVPWFLGDGFDKVVPLLSILGFLIIVIGISNVTGLQYLIPTKRQNLLTLTVGIGAAVNFVLNMILIRFYGSIGAAVASVAAETVISAMQLFFVRKELSVKKILTDSWKYIAASMVMLVTLKVFGGKMTPSILHTFVMTICGMAVYAAGLLILRDQFFIDNIKSVLSRLYRPRGGRG